MDKLKAIKRIQESKLSEDKKDMLCNLVSDFDLFLQLKKKHPEQGLLAACYKNLGFRFLGMYGINTIDDVVSRAENNSLL